MPDLAMGDRIRERVRSFFRKGHKSGNKVYAVNPDGSIDNALWATIQLKAATRINHALESQKLRLGGFASNYDMAEALTRVPMQDRAGNCGEQAALAAWYVLKSEFLRRDRIYIATITDPGDHVFCLISEAPIANAGLAYPSVRAFCRDGVAPGYLIIDPWLNTTCAGHDYLLQGGQKLDKWQAEGKRVCWHAGLQGPGWYPPAGEYKDVFALAPVTITPF